MSGIFSLIPRAALIATLLSTVAFADTREERLAVAQEYTEKSIADMDMDALIRTMWEPLLPATGVTATDEQKAELQVLYMETFETKMIDILHGQSEIMANLLTLEELEALRDFYATPLGSSVMQKMPKMIEQLNPEIMAMVQETLPIVIPKAMDILQVKQ